MATSRARLTVFLMASTVGVLVLIVVAAVVAGRTTASITTAAADRQAAHEVELLATIGARIPDLTQSTFAGGLSRAARHELDVAVAAAQHEGLLANLVVWDRNGRTFYSSATNSMGSQPGAQRELVAALAGRATTRTHPHEFDPSSGKHSGVLDAFEPLSDAHGNVYGAVEASLPLYPIRAAATHSRERTVLIVIGSGVLLWLMLLPLWVRLARSQANTWIPGRRRTLRAFANALDHSEIELVYQPQINPHSRRVDAVEALVRWRRNGKLVGPDKYLTTVESSALMPKLTDRVLDLALAQLADWRHAGIDIRVSVNISSTDLADNKLPERIAAKLDRHRMTGENLTIEITETAILDDPKQARPVLTALHKLGVDIALDDFGTGHASISRLHDPPVFSEVKIDRSFVCDTGHRSRTYLRAMVGFGRSLGLRVVAEGVEDAETLAILAALNCDLAQGYFISRPLEPAAITRWLTASHTTTADPRNSNTSVYATA